MATAPTLFWYQLDSGTLSATYFGQLNATVAELCSENAVAAPTAPWQNSIGGTLFSQWQVQIDTAVRALCTALAVTAPIPLILGSNTGQYQSEYAESLDGVVRALCAAYHADAVHFDGSVWLTNAALACTDNAYFGFSWWFRIASPQSNIIWTDASQQQELFFNPSASNKLHAYLGDLINSSMQIQQSSAAPSLDTWHNLIVAANSEVAAAKKFKMKLDGVDVTTVINSGGTDPYNILLNGLEFIFGGDGFPGDAITADVADVQMYRANLLDGSGDITEATERLFRSAAGKPVDPAGAIAALGTPMVLFSGDAASFGANQGSGGAFTPTGSLTNASTSPSD